LKFVFGSPELDYLGFRISRGIIQPGKKVKSIAAIPRPVNEHEVRRFLGLTGYFRWFIVDYAKLSNPLTCLMKKDVRFCLGKEQETAYVALKEKICDKPVVCMYDANVLHPSLKSTPMRVQWHSLAFCYRVVTNSS
jgi:hypothetical protein